MTTAVLVLAAGAGLRLGEPGPKALVPLGGRPLIGYSLEAIEASGVIDRTVLVVPGADIARARQLVTEIPGAGAVDDIVAGGDTRQASVRCGLAALPQDVDVVICHDGARPFASPVLFRRVVEALESTGAQGAVPAVASPDTVKRVADGRIIETIPREAIGLVQTPQAFDADTLRKAHHEALGAGLEATDDAMLLEALGSLVVIVEGEASNFKITTADDLRRAEGMLAARDGGPRR
jgi:2-C-methyl-D-erythritol 4-phosphate cytidylyltransferase